MSSPSQPFGPDPSPGETSPPPGPYPQQAPVRENTRQWALAAHLAGLIAVTGIPSFLGPLTVWLLRKDQDHVVAAHAAEALNFHLSVTIYALVLGALSVPATLLTFGLLLAPLIPLAFLALAAVLGLSIYAAVRASEGGFYRYPLTIRLIR